jgi:hypothetical protein
MKILNELNKINKKYGGWFKYEIAYLYNQYLKKEITEKDIKTIIKEL